MKIRSAVLVCMLFGCTSQVAPLTPENPEPVRPEVSFAAPDVQSMGMDAVSHDPDALSVDQDVSPSKDTVSPVDDAPECKLDEDCTQDHASPCFIDVCDQQSWECKVVELVCDDGNPCTDDYCENKSCFTKANTLTCDDGDACTGFDQCVNRECVGQDVCGCLKSDPTCSKLDDGNLCNGVYFCDDSLSVPECVFDNASVITCFDEDLEDCHITWCEPETGICESGNADLETPCDDGDPCTLNDVCYAGGVCGDPTKHKCDDGNYCTTDSCLDGICSHEPYNVPCDDGDPDTIVDLCKDTVCKGVPFFQEHFDDGVADNWTITTSDPLLTAVVAEVSATGWENDPSDLYLAVSVTQAVTLESEVVIRIESPVIEIPETIAPVLKFSEWIDVPCERAEVRLLGYADDLQQTHCGEQELSPTKILFNTSQVAHAVALEVVLKPGTHEAGEWFRFDSFILQPYYIE